MHMQEFNILLTNKIEICPNFIRPDVAWGCDLSPWVWNRRTHNDSAGTIMWLMVPAERLSGCDRTILTLYYRSQPARFVFLIKDEGCPAV